MSEIRQICHIPAARARGRRAFMDRSLCDSAVDIGGSLEEDVEKRAACLGNHGMNLRALELGSGLAVEGVAISRRFRSRPGHYGARSISPT